MSNSYNNKPSSSKKSVSDKSKMLEAVQELVCRCDKSYYDYLSDIRASYRDDSCDYCTAFMLA